MPCIKIMIYGGVEAYRECSTVYWPGQFGLGDEAGGRLLWMLMNLAMAFAESARKDLRKTALYWGDREYSYAELLEQTARVAEHLQEQFGVKPGDRVGLWLKNCPEFVPALFGILEAGGVVVPINNFLKPAEVSYMLADAGADVLITDVDDGGFCAGIAAGTAGVEVAVGGAVCGADALSGSGEGRPECAGRRRIWR